MALHAVFLERKPQTRTHPASPNMKLRFSPWGTLFCPPLRQATQSNRRNDNRRFKKRLSAAWSGSALRYMLLADDFGTTGGLSSPSRWSAVAGSFGLRRAKDSFTAVRCHTRSLSQIKHPAAAGFFIAPRRASSAATTCVHRFSQIEGATYAQK
jgi:hypothetical protein